LVRRIEVKAADVHDGQVDLAEEGEVRYAEGGSSLFCGWTREREKIHTRKDCQRFMFLGILSLSSTFLVRFMGKRDSGTSLIDILRLYAGNSEGPKRFRRNRENWSDSVKIFKEFVMNTTDLKSVEILRID
jgi:hypothetical protein